MRKNRTYRLAIVHPSLKIMGGAENVVIWLAEELSSRGHQVDIITTDYDSKFYGTRSKKDYRIITIPQLGGYYIRPLRWIKNGWIIRNRLKNYDFINCHNFPSYIWVYFAKLFNRNITSPIVWFCEEPVRSYYEDTIDKHVLEVLKTDRMPDTRSIFNRSGSFIANENIKIPLRLYQRTKERVAIYFAKRLDEFIAPKLDLIMTNSKFIASMVKKIFNVDAVPCLLGVPMLKKVRKQDIKYKDYILTVSRLEYRKNILNILRAIKLLVNSNDFDAKKYVIVGKGPIKDQIERYINNNGLNQIVEVKGFVSDKELQNLYLNTKLIVYLTLDETFGLPFAEAGLYSKAVIGPNHGGPSEIVKHKQTGIQVDALNPKNIASGISYALKDNVRLKKFGTNNYKYVAKNLSFEKFTDRFLKIIESKYDKK